MITLDIPESAKDIVRASLESTALILKAAVLREMDAEPRLPSPSEMQRWSDVRAWIEHAVEQLK